MLASMFGTPPLRLDRDRPRTRAVRRWPSRRRGRRPPGGTRAKPASPACARARARSRASRSTFLRASMARAMFERSKSSVVVPTYQPRFSSPMRLRAGTRTSSKKTSLKTWPFAMLIERPDGDAGRLHVEQQVADAAVLRRVRVRAGEHEHPVGEVGAGGPDLLAVDDVVVAVADGAGLEAGEVAAGAGLAEALAPRDLAAEDAAGGVRASAPRCRGA